ncbi:molybdopterin-dependent oxidoreductase [Rhizobium oryzicola]|uniref:Molybdopterin-dependent oxidoreductase n=1 Tax=Rhizobium oryzicola TaxID=1232668 RepID=A0ABT8SWQ2_9HYPH|nr:molybdopterin-dependent oxidoreductase [Rhizobium oryzicola]MDO1582781.1 molybdopterin-dependent oxidoreductase [Rhizobium oryzicola]
MKITRRTLNVGLLGAAGLFLSGTAHSQSKPILTIDGLISKNTVDGTATFDRAGLEALGVESFETKCPWYTGPVKFEGPLMSRVLDHVGATGKTLVVQALNDYSTEIPIEDFKRFRVILAMKRDGEYMPVRDKGPLFIVYPYDSDPELQSQLYYKRSAWQVARMTVK